MKQTLLVIASIFIVTTCFAQAKPKAKKDTAAKIAPAAAKDSAAKPKDTAPVKEYYFKASPEQVKGFQYIFQSYNAEDLSDVGKYKAWQEFLSHFTIDSTYKPKK